MENKWFIVYESYEGHQRKAVEKIAGAIGAETGYAIPCIAHETVTEEMLKNNHPIFIGTARHWGMDCKPQGYALRVCQSCYSADHQMISICGADDIGVLYGAVDFINHYMGTGMFEHADAVVTELDYFSRPFRTTTPEYQRSSAPSLDKRGLWTWGHCLYDYRRFLENMLSLKLNQIVIWNDHMPLNAKEVVAYAHALGIEVYWGFAWGWSVNCLAPGFRIDDDRVIDEWSEKVFAQYRDHYAATGADGIYFQSFTEAHTDTIDGVLIAEAVTKWVNRIGGRLLDAYPELNIQFGLHATSVRNHLDEIRTVDPRIRIVWEDCGAFPYHYDPRKLDDLEQTLQFNEQICTLRGESEAFGAVLKGMTKLDWTRFEHQAGPFVMGTHPRAFIAERSHSKQRLWKFLSSYWMQNAPAAQQVIRQIADKTHGGAHVQMLVEDGCFEEAISLPVALCAEMLWDCKADIPDLIGAVSRFPILNDV